MNWLGRLRRTTLICLAAHMTATSLADRASIFTAQRYRAHVETLASDQFRGRGLGQEGIELAARYIAEQFKAAGLEPGGADGTYLQPFELKRVKQLDAAAAELRISGLEQRLQIFKEWTPLSFSGLEAVEGPLAFAGYGIDSDDHDYSDYDDFDAKGKILIVLRYEPRSENADAAFGGRTPSRHALFATKARVAARQGALGMLIVNPPGRDEDGDSLISFDYQFRAGGQSYELPMAQITQAVANKLLLAAGKPDLEALTRTLDQDRSPNSFDLPEMQATLNPGLHAASTANVVGFRPGDGSTDEFIVVGAHYDHLGTRTDEDRSVIFNGADDNASGTAALIELARAAGRGRPLKRGIYFVAFSAEEIGLVGSRHFVANSPVDLERVVFMLNMDMVGRRGQDRLAFSGVDTSPGFVDLLDAATARARVKWQTDDQFFSRSDHVNFYERGIPVLFAFTGIHDQYHRPGDDAALIHAQGAVGLLDTLWTVVRTIASAEQAPAFRKRETESQPSRDPVERLSRQNDSDPNSAPTSAPTSQSTPE